MTNIYLTDLDEEAIVHFVKDCEKLYDKNTDHFSQKARKESFCQGAQDLVGFAKDTLWQAHSIQAWTGPTRDDGGTGYRINFTH